MKLLSIIFILIPALVSSQVDTISLDLFPPGFDSVQFSVWNVQTKEMSSMGNETEYEKELARKTISENDANNLIKLLTWNKAYSNSRALIHHYNLQFEIFDSGGVITRIGISGMNGNVDIERDELELIFRNSCSSKLSKRLFKLIEDYGFNELLDEFELEGLK